MTDALYDLVFKGELIKNADLQQTKRNIQALFKISESKVEALFSGKAITLKKGLGFDAATKYRVAIKKAGAVIELIEQVSEVRKTQGKAVFGTADPSEQIGSEQNSAASDVTQSDSVKNRSAENERTENPDIAKRVNEKTTEGSLVLAPVGADVLTIDERLVEESVSLDLAAYSMADQEGNLLRPDEQTDEPVANIHLDENISLSDVGANLLSSEEREKEDALDVDTSNLSMSEPGVVLVESKNEAEVEVDISHLSLAAERTDV